MSTANPIALSTSTTRPEDARLHSSVKYERSEIAVGGRMTTFAYIPLTVPKNNTCRYKVHRFRDSGYATLPRDAQGRVSRTVKTTFVVQHCADVKCAAARLSR